MIKFFQKLKAKKGFTLVELIVVIAIIGVLAAILVPTMLGYVTNSRVTSADSTAASIAKEIDSFLTDCDTAGYGMKKGTAYTDIEIEITAAGWKLTLKNMSASAFNNGNGITWSTNAASGITSSTQKTSASGKGEALMAIQLAGLFPDLKSGNIYAAISGGHCIACAYTADSVTPATLKNVFAITAATGSTPASLTNKMSTAWDGNTAGVMKTGEIVGTSPKLGLKLS